MKTYQYKAQPFKSLQGISDKTNAVHDKLYQGYIKKKDEIQEKLQNVELGTANQTYSDLRALKDAETFAVNGVYLHDIYFQSLGGDGRGETLEVVKALNDHYGSLEQSLSLMKACGLAARGWVILTWDTFEGGLHIYTGDAHNQGGVWGALPILTLDVYEHAYFMDYGSDRGAYIDSWMKNIDWKNVNERFKKYRGVSN